MKKLILVFGEEYSAERYIMDKLGEMSSQVEGVVNMGAGVDTLVYTLDSINKLPIWELDQDVIIKSKEIRLNKIVSSIPENIKSIGIDFDHEDIGAILEKKWLLRSKKDLLYMGSCNPVFGRKKC